jgi:hypothetical protein
LLNPENPRLFFPRQNKNVTLVSEVLFQQRKYGVTTDDGTSTGQNGCQYKGYARTGRRQYKGLAIRQEAYREREEAENKAWLERIETIWQAYRGGPGSIPGLVKWDLWWTKWSQGRFSPSTSVSPAIHSTKFSILTITRGRYNKPVSGRRVEWTQFGFHPPLCKLKKKSGRPTEKRQT